MTESNLPVAEVPAPNDLHIMKVPIQCTDGCEHHVLIDTTTLAITVPDHNLPMERFKNLEALGGDLPPCIRAASSFMHLVEPFHYNPRKLWDILGQIADVAEKSIEDSKKAEVK